MKKQNDYIELLDNIHKNLISTHIKMVNSSHTFTHFADNKEREKREEDLSKSLDSLQMIGQLKDCFIGVPICEEHIFSSLTDLTETIKGYDLEQMADIFEQQIQVLDKTAHKTWFKRHFS